MNPNFLTKCPFLPDYVFGEKLGSGSFGVVYKAVRKINKNEVLAIKCLKRSSLNSSTRENLISEISALKKLHHTHIVNMIDFQWDNTYIYIIMELCEAGDLASYLKKHPCILESIACNFLQQLAGALRYMHERHISHLDLKPANILLTKDAVLKIADFGLAHHWRDSRQADQMRGSLLYMAPEMLIHKKFDYKADLWSVGVILYECLFGQAPFKAPSFDRLVQMITSDDPIVVPSKPTTSPQCKDLIDNLLQRDPSQRFSVNQLLTHPFIHPPALLSLARETAHKATRFYNRGHLHDALDRYCQAVQYYIPCVKSEQSAYRKEMLKKETDECIKKAEKVKSQLNSKISDEMHEGDSIYKRITAYEIQEPSSSTFQQPTTLYHIKPQPTTSQEPTSQQNEATSLQTTTSNKQDQLSQQINTYQNISTLHQQGIIDALKSQWHDNTHMVSALNVIPTAYKKVEINEDRSALERFEAAIGVMLKLLKSEPQSKKKEILQIQISRWISEAEEIKERLSVRVPQVEESFDKNSCLIQ